MKTVLLSNIKDGKQDRDAVYVASKDELLSWRFGLFCRFGKFRSKLFHKSERDGI